MTTQTRKPLSLKAKSDTNTITGLGDGTIKRSRKRIIKRDQLPAAKLATTKKPPPKPKPKKKPKPASPKAPSPSDVRLDNLSASLNAFDTWRNWQPLALGIEKAVFQHIAKHQLSCSKRVVKKLLHQHTADPRYLSAVKSGGHRLNLDGTKAGAISTIEREYAVQILEVNNVRT